MIENNFLIFNSKRIIYMVRVPYCIMKHAKSYSGVWLPDATEIKRMRVDRGWTQAELAKKAVVSQALIAKFERGEAEPVTCQGEGAS